MKKQKLSYRVKYELLKIAIEIPLLIATYVGLIGYWFCK